MFYICVYWIAAGIEAPQKSSFLLTIPLQDKLCSFPREPQAALQYWGGAAFEVARERHVERREGCARREEEKKYPLVTSRSNGSLTIPWQGRPTTLTRRPPTTWQRLGGPTWKRKKKLKHCAGWKWFIIIIYHDSTNVLHHLPSFEREKIFKCESRILGCAKQLLIGLHFLPCLSYFLRDSFFHKALLSPKRLLFAEEKQKSNAESPFSLPVTVEQKKKVCFPCAVWPFCFRPKETFLLLMRQSQTNEKVSTAK